MATRHVDIIRALLRREVGTIRKPDGSNLRVALAFPNTYYVGMSNLGFQVVYRIFNEIPGTLCERVFLPEQRDFEDLRRTTSSLVTMESQSPLREFDVLAFSVSYELDYFNIPRILSLGRISELANDRGEEEPLIIAGGPAVTFNPEPLAPFVDVFVIGEGEEVIPEVVSVLRDGGERLHLLERLAQIQGIYVPRFYEPKYKRDGMIERVSVTADVPMPVRRRWVRDLDKYNPGNPIRTPDTEFSNMAIVEIARGCGRRCRFCVAGHVYLPPRKRSASSVLRCLEETPRAERVGLLGASVFDHSEFMDICNSLLQHRRLFSVSSVRLDLLTEEIAEMLHRGGQQTITVAPEAGTERLRQIIGKPLTDQQIFEGMSAAWNGGLRRIKMYFMVGLPTETEEDVKSIAQLARTIASSFRWERLVVSVSCFVPKPWTPFQWVPMEKERELSSKLAMIRRELKAEKNVRLTAESAREAVVQGTLARGDRRLHSVIGAVASGSRSWKNSISEAGLSVEFYAYRAREREEVFPWDHIDQGIAKSHLLAECDSALQAPDKERRKPSGSTT